MSGVCDEAKPPTIVAICDDLHIDPSGLSTWESAFNLGRYQLLGIGTSVIPRAITAHLEIYRLLDLSSIAVVVA
jgi:hypothetical protein